MNSSTKTLFTLETLVAEGQIAKDWGEALRPARDEIAALGALLHEELAAGRHFLPTAGNVWRSFRDPLANVKVLIVGQDPYPTPGHAMGLAFATKREVQPIPRSLKNIYREIEDDLGIKCAPVGDLSAWAGQGVMLLNRVLTVQSGIIGSHEKFGWQSVTELAIRALIESGSPPVTILWGAKARSLGPLFAGLPVIESAHPSPLSASRGFFGSKPFSRVNEALIARGQAPIDWKIT